MDLIWPYLYMYVKTNNLTVWFCGIILFSFLWPYIPIKLSMRPLNLLLLIVILGAVLRVGWLCYSSHQPKADRVGITEEHDLINISAVELTEGKFFLDGKGNPTGRRPIGYPLFLGFMYKLFGTSIQVAWIANLFLHVLTILLIYVIANLIWSTRVSLLSSFLFAIYPTSIYSIIMTIDEHLFLPVWYGGLWILMKQLKNHQTPRLDWVIFGVVFGYATMIRTHTIFMPFVVGFAYWFLNQPIRKIIARVLLTFLMMQFVNLPWVIRNYQAFGVPVLYTATGYYVYAQMNATATPKGEGHIPLKGEEGYSVDLENAMASGNEGMIHKIANEQMKKWILSHPLKVLMLGTGRLLFFMNFSRDGGVWPLWYQFYEGSFDPARPLVDPIKSIFEEAAFILYYLILFGSIISVPLLFMHRKLMSVGAFHCLLILALCFIFYFLEHMIIYPIRKYRYPIEPFMMMLTAYTLSFIAEKPRLNLLSRFFIHKK